MRARIQRAAEILQRARSDVYFGQFVPSSPSHPSRIGRAKRETLLSPELQVQAPVEDYSFRMATSISV